MPYTPGDPPPPPGWTPPSEQPPPWQTPPASPGGYPPGQQTGWGQQAPWGQYGGPPPNQAVPKPGVIPLRPLGVGEILDGTFTTMRRYPKATLGLSAVVASAGAIVQLLFTLATRDTSDVDGAESAALVVTIVGFLLTALATLILTGMLTAVIGEAVLGRPVDLGAVWARIRPRIGSIVGASILVAIVAGLGFLALVIPGIYLVVALSFTVPVLILEGQKPAAAMKRSRELVKGSWWRVAGILLLAGIIANIVGSVIAFPFLLASGGGSMFDFAAESDQVGTGALVMQALGSIVANTITTPITAGAAVLLYLDRRMRREGLDVTLAQAAAAAPNRPGY